MLKKYLFLVLCLIQSANCGKDERNALLRHSNSTMNINSVNSIAVLGSINCKKVWGIYTDQGIFVLSDNIKHTDVFVINNTKYELMTIVGKFACFSNPYTVQDAFTISFDCDKLKLQKIIGDKRRTIISEFPELLIIDKVIYGYFEMKKNENTGCLSIFKKSEKAEYYPIFSFIRTNMLIYNKNQQELKRRKNIRKLLLQILENIEKEEPTICLNSNAYAKLVVLENKMCDRSIYDDITEDTIFELAKLANKNLLTLTKHGVSYRDIKRLLVIDNGFLGSVVSYSGVTSSV